MMAPDGGGERGGEAEELRVGGRLLSQARHCPRLPLPEMKGWRAAHLTTARALEGRGEWGVGREEEEGGGGRRRAPCYAA